MKSGPRLQGAGGGVCCRRNRLLRLRRVPSAGALRAVAGEGSSMFSFVFFVTFVLMLVLLLVF